MKKAELQKLVQDQKALIESLTIGTNNLHNKNISLQSDKRRLKDEIKSIAKIKDQLIADKTQLEYRVNKLSEYSSVLENDISESDAKLLEVRKRKNEKIKKIYGQFKHFLSIHKEDEVIISDCYSVMERSSNVIRMLHDQNEHLSDELSISKYKLRCKESESNMHLNNFKCSEKITQNKSIEIIDLKRRLDESIKVRIDRSIEVNKLNKKLYQISKNPFLSFIKPRSWFK